MDNTMGDQEFDLEEWALKKGLGSRPNCDDAATEWICDVEDSFLNDPTLPPPNSVDFIDSGN